MNHRVMRMACVLLDADREPTLAQRMIYAHTLQSLAFDLERANAALARIAALTALPSGADLARDLPPIVERLLLDARSRAA